VEELSVSGSFHVTLSAFNKAEFDTAYQLFSGLADENIAEAQINIGIIFEKGKGFHRLRKSRQMVSSCKQIKDLIMRNIT
jgi:TPR repeat protein